VAFAPGRVNLIGEHTDYNGGLALPFAIELGLTVSARPRDQATIAVDALELGEHDEFPLADPPPVPGWRAFVRGVAALLQQAGSTLTGAELEIGGGLPRGAGLSSSAALEISTALALLTVAGRPEPDRVELARLCSRVENEWVGAETGLLDQLACLFGEAEHAVLLDMRDVTIDAVPMRLDGWRLAVADSGVRHELAASGYNERRRECAQAAQILDIPSLREATAADLDLLPPPLDRRVRHVLEENQRVQLAVAALQTNDVAALGPLLHASHASLRDLFQVSVPAVEQTVRRLVREGAAGARIIGGGFGGSVLALFAPDVAPPDWALEVRPGPAARVLEAQA
jgi:galactokinase